MNKKKLIILISILIALAVLGCVGIFVLPGNRASQIADNLDLGEKYLAELEYEKALAAYQEVLKIDPKNVEAYVGIVDAYVAMGDYDNALKYAEEGYEETESRKLEKKIEEVESLMNGGQGMSSSTENPSGDVTMPWDPVPEPDFEDYAIDWIDPNLEKAMREVTEIYDRDIMYSDVRDITELDLAKSSETEDADKISDISALSNLTNLMSLNMNYNTISDISVLSNLTNLTELNLSENNINDISALGGLTNLTKLNLWNNNISDISALSSLTNLTILWLGENAISDISILSSLTNLTHMALDDNSISDISALSSLTNLTNLALGDNSISDISALSSLTNLTNLSLAINNISDISALSSLTNLTFVNVEDNNIADYSPVAHVQDVIK